MSPRRTTSIKVCLMGNARLSALADRNLRVIADKVLADSLTDGRVDYAFSKEWNVNGETVTIAVEKV